MMVSKKVRLFGLRSWNALCPHIYDYSTKYAEKQPKYRTTIRYFCLVMLFVHLSKKPNLFSKVPHQCWVNYLMKQRTDPQNKLIREQYQ